MALGWNLNQFKNWINGILPDNNARAISEADMRDALNTLATYADERAAASETQAAATLANFVTRSLAMNATAYVDGTNGNDANTGASQAQAVKTLTRLSALFSGKAVNLLVYVIGTVEVTANVSLSCTGIQFMFFDGGRLLFKKLPTDNGNYWLGLDTLTAQFQTLSAGVGYIEAEAHSGNVTSEATSTYMGRQGCIRLWKNSMMWWRSACRIQLIDVRTVTCVVGNNTVLLAGTEAGAVAIDYTRTSYLFLGSSYTTISLGTNSQLSYGFDGSKTYIRTYTPTSSTDANVQADEITKDTSFLYVKINGTIRKATLSAF